MQKQYVLSDKAQQIADYNNWQDKYRALMKLGGERNKSASVLQSNENLVDGCESQVWVSLSCSDNQWHIDAVSDSRIVSGLIDILLDCLNQQTAQFIAEFQVNDYFFQLGLGQQISESRSKGLQHIWHHINEQIQSHV